MRRAHQPVDVGDRNRGNDKGRVDDGLPQQGFFLHVGRIDERFQQVDGGNPDDGRGELHFQHVGVDVRQPLRLVRVAFQIKARHEGFVAADDDHDEQVGNHHHVDQPQHDEHDGFFGHRQGAHDQVLQLDHEMHHIHALRDDQAEIQRHLQPAAAEQNGGEHFAAALDNLDGCLCSHGVVLELLRKRV